MWRSVLNHEIPLDTHSPIPQDHLRENCEAFKLMNIYGNPARERFLTIYIKRQCSSIRNSFRELVRTSG